MKILPTRDEYIPTWINPIALENLWKINQYSYVSSWDGDPKITWFSYDIPEVRTGFYTADMYIKNEEGKVVVGFVNGRHRTRWLLSKSMEFIPIGLQEDQFDIALKMNLAVARIQPHEEIIV